MCHESIPLSWYLGVAIPEVAILRSALRLPPGSVSPLSVASTVIGSGPLTALEARFARPFLIIEGGVPVRIGIRITCHTDSALRFHAAGNPLQPSVGIACVLVRSDDLLCE